MPKPKTKPLELVDVCRALPRSQRGWRHAATDDQRAQMDALKAAYHRGEIVAPIRKIHETVTSVLKLAIGRDSLSEFLNEGRPSKPA